MIQFDRYLTPPEINRTMKANSRKRGFRVENIGYSSSGRELFMSVLGSGEFKVLLVGYPHPNEPIGGTLGVYLALNKEILESLNCTLYFVHALETDSALKNLGWINSEFSFEKYIHHSFIDSIENQAEFCFPTSENLNAYKIESTLLLKLFHELQPDLYCPLHSSPTIGGAQFYLSKSDLKLITKLAQLANQHGIYIDPVPRGNHLPIYTPGFFGLYAYQNLPVKRASARESSYLYFRKVIKNHSVAFEIPFASTAQSAHTLIDKDFSEVVVEFNNLVPTLTELIHQLKLKLRCIQNQEVRESIHFWTENWPVKPLKPISRYTYQDLAENANCLFTIILLLGWWERVSSDFLESPLKIRLTGMMENLNEKFKLFKPYLRIIPIQEQIEIYTECLKFAISAFHTFPAAG